jgi:hypothetical protein
MNPSRRTDTAIPTRNDTHDFNAGGGGAAADAIPEPQLVGIGNGATDAWLIELATYAQGQIAKETEKQAEMTQEQIDAGPGLKGKFKGAKKQSCHKINGALIVIADALKNKHRGQPISAQQLKTEMQQFFDHFQIDINAGRLDTDILTDIAAGKADHVLQQNIGKKQFYQKKAPQRFDSLMNGRLGKIMDAIPARSLSHVACEVLNIDRTGPAAIARPTPGGR